MIDAIGTRTIRARNPFNPRHVLEDLYLTFKRNRDGEYVLNSRLPRRQAFLVCYKPAINPVEMIAREGRKPWYNPFSKGKLLSVSRGSNTKMTAGLDYQTRLINGDAAANVGETNTSTGVTATTLTRSGATWTTNQWAGHLVVTGASSTYGVILSNTATVLTIDKWYAPGTPGGAAATTPATGAYLITLASQPNQWIALSTDATAPSAGDTTLASEVNTAGVTRSFATYAHTGGASTATLSYTFTATGNAGNMQKAGCFNAANGGVMYCESLLNAAANLAVSGDNAAVTWTFTHS